MKATVAYPDGARHAPNGHDRCGLCERAWPCPTVRKAARSHRVAQVGFVAAALAGISADAAAVDCSCGWAGIVADWSAHQRA